VSIHFDSVRTDTVKASVLASFPQSESFDPELIKSWKRSQDAVGLPSRITDVPQVSEDELDSHLLNMFQAPLTRFAENLEGTGLGLLLADARGQIVQVWCHDRSALAHLDRVGTMRGSVLAENVVGTNGIGTVLATGKSVQISGNEHFAEFYRDAVCTGSPIRHPITGQLMGAVTLSTDVTPRADLLRPLLKSLSMQLEQHVVALAQPSTRHMFDVFLAESRSGSGAVVGFGPQGVLMQNPAASWLTTGDLHAIQQLCHGVHGDKRVTAELSDGPAHLSMRALDSGNVVVVIDLQTRISPRETTRTIIRPPSPQQLAGRSSEWLGAVHQLAKMRESTLPLIIAGESGVGKVSLALGHPFQHGVVGSRGVVVDAAGSHIIGGRKWLQRLSDRLAVGETTVIRGIETLDAPVLDGLRSLLEDAKRRGPVIMTLTARRPEDADAFKRRFAASAIWIPPLRDRFSDVAQLWSAFAKSLAPDAGLEPKPETIELMRKYRWPGNTKELRTIISQLALGGKSGLVASSDLPEEMQNSRSLSLIERVELDALRNALSEAGGNRAKAAEILGLSRATVYRKMKSYRLE
jgi:transcriptional regulator of acetoin/glycerol metabolism